MPIGYKSFFKLTAAAVIAASGSFALNSEAVAQGDSNSAESEIKKTTEPVFRVAKLVDAKDDTKAGVKDETPKTTKDIGPKERIAKLETPGGNSVAVPAAAPHPLDRALSFARSALTSMQDDVVDYTATMAKRERINGVVGEPNYMKIKIRCPRTDAQGVAAPFSIYMKFLKPTETTGREVIWVDGDYDNKLVVHEGKGLIRFKTFHLDPMGMIALRGQRYPVYEAGLENLIVKLIEKAERDRAAGTCIVNYKEGLKLNKRECSMIELIHNDRKAPYEFYKAQVFIDKELNLPVRYVAYDWPKHEGAKPELMEEYTYFNIKTNVGLTAKDFDIKNKSYKFR